MPTSSKRPSKLAAPPRVKPLVKASSRPAQPFRRFYHSKSLRAKTLAVLTTLEKAKDSTQHRDALADIVVKLTDSGMEYYFLKPLKLAKADFFVEQSANLALSVTDHAYFIEKGVIRFDGSSRELLERDDLLRSVFLAAKEGAA